MHTPDPEKSIVILNSASESQTIWPFVSDLAEQPGATIALTDAKIYERVRDKLAQNFRSHFKITLQAKAQGQRKLLMACIDRSAPKPHEKLWG